MADDHEAGQLEDGTHHSASADPDVEVWMSWLACAFVVNPDPAFLADSGGERFAMMDIKLALSGQTGQECGRESNSTEQRLQRGLMVNAGSNQRHQGTRKENLGSRAACHAG